MLVIIGPCALESENQILPIIDLCLKHNIIYFRAQLFKPRTSPTSFQGLGTKGLDLLKLIQSKGIRLVCEACSVEQLSILKNYASIIQIGARNMQNFEFLKVIGKELNTNNNFNDHKIILKRGFGNTEDELIASAKYIERSGIAKENIILCERGSRTFANANGIALDFNLALRLKQNSGYKVIIDPSHGSKQRSLVLPLAQASIAMSFDGFQVEVHPNPSMSLSDPLQALDIKELDSFLSDNKKYLSSSFKIDTIKNYNNRNDYFDHQII